MLVDYPLWDSPIAIENVVEKTVRFGQVAVDGLDLYWIESRPDEAGRNALVKNGLDILSEESIHSLIHVYGGGAFSVQNGTLVFTTLKDQNLFLLTQGQKRQITHEKECRFGEPLLDLKRNCLYTIYEQHREGHVENSLARVDLQTGEIEMLARGGDFYASLALSPDGKELAYITWSHPYMAWDQSALRVIALDATGHRLEDRIVKQGDGISVCLPRYTPQGDLIFLSDESGYWNFETEKGALFSDQAEYGEALWVLGQSRYGFHGSSLYAIATREGEDQIICFDGQIKPLNLPFTSIRQLYVQGDALVFIGASLDHPAGLYRYDLLNHHLSLIRPSQAATLDSSWLSTPQKIAFTNRYEQKVFALYYPPRNPSHKIGEHLPPLIVRCHGGPSAHVTPTYALETLFWTSRGFAVCDVNYGGSTGHGRAYRQRLAARWGLLDVTDVIEATHILLEKSLADPQNLFIRGSSAGGFTLLNVLAQSSLFSGATCLYGVSDLKALDAHTHKFEAHYTDTLLGKDKDLAYRTRSPVYQVDHMHTPILFLQGIDDKVVPKEQAEIMVRALEKKNIPCRLMLFEGEAHGFRKANTIQTALESELTFYKTLLKKPSP